MGLGETHSLDWGALLDSCDIIPDKVTGGGCNDTDVQVVEGVGGAGEGLAAGQGEGEEGDEEAGGGQHQPGRGGGQAHGFHLGDIFLPGSGSRPGLLAVSVETSGD